MTIQIIKETLKQLRCRVSCHTTACVTWQSELLFQINPPGNLISGLCWEHESTPGRKHVISSRDYDQEPFMVNNSLQNNLALLNSKWLTSLKCLTSVWPLFQCLVLVNLLEEERLQTPQSSDHVWVSHTENLRLVILFSCDVDVNMLPIYISSITSNITIHLKSCLWLPDECKSNKIIKYNIWLFGC